MNYISTVSERLADSIIHVVGLVAGALGVTAMLICGRVVLARRVNCDFMHLRRGHAMLGLSAAYHMKPAAKCNELLRRLDHAAIFLKIAGTYTPFAATSRLGV